MKEEKRMEYILETHSLCKTYKNFKALDGLNMHVPKGSVYGFVGKNGAGKTTLIRQICGLQEPSAGEYALFGVSCCNDAEINKVRKRMGAVVETPSIYSNMSARDNLKEQYKLLGLPDYDGIDEILEMVGLKNTGNKAAGKFSLGMRGRLGIAVALCGHPDFLVLDEPINGLDPEGIIEIRELILKLNREENITILISSHILDELSKLATWYGFIDSGHMLCEMSAEELEKTSLKSIKIEVSDILALSRVMEQLKLEYRVISDNTAEIYADISITKLVHALDKESCELLEVKSNDESLESFYMNLMGGEVHE